MTELLAEINSLIAVGVDPTVAANTVNAERARKAQQSKISIICSSFIVLHLVFVFSCLLSSCILMFLCRFLPLISSGALTLAPTGEYLNNSPLV